MGVRPVPTTADEFRAFYGRNLPDHSSELVRADFATQENALERSREETIRLLPQG